MMRFGLEGLRRAGDFPCSFGGPGSILVIIGWVLLLALVVFCTVVSIKYLVAAHKQKKSKAAADTAVAILKERYARGEIAEEEYTQKIKILND